MRARRNQRRSVCELVPSFNCRWGNILDRRRSYRIIDWKHSSRIGSFSHSCSECCCICVIDYGVSALSKYSCQSNKKSGGALLPPQARFARFIGRHGKLLASQLASQIRKKTKGQLKQGYMAEEEGFEPPERSHAQRFSRPPHSTTLPLLRSRTLPFLQSATECKSCHEIACICLVYG